MAQEIFSFRRLQPLVYLSNNVISFIGVLLTTTAGVAWLFLLPVHFGEQAGHPYLGLLTILGLPAMFFTGLLLIPLGVRIKERRQRRTGLYPASFPPLNWQNPEFRNLLSFVTLATIANVVIGGHLTYNAVEYMDSTAFCGTACHVMNPEFTAYQFAEHSNVGCVDCHIGAGAGSYIQAKLNGVNQLFGVMFDSYPRPVPTPVHNLAQGELTCGECHAQRDLGTKREEWIHFAEDEANSASRTELVLAIGGGNNTQGAHGAHMGAGAKIEYRSDPSREKIPWIRYTAPSGETAVYTTSDWDPSMEEEFELRTMDCVDCHNRPAHTFEVAHRAIDRAMVEGTIDPALPFIKKQGLELVKANYSSKEEAPERMEEELRAFYTAEYPEAAVDKRAEIERAAQELAAIYSRNVFPEMRVDWGTYPNHLGHEDYPGCYRCHDTEHTSPAGEAIGQECVSCHAMVAVDEPLEGRQLDQARTLLTSAQAEAGAGLPQTLSYDTRLGPVTFDHARHVELEEGDCLACHTQLFPMAKSETLNYGGADLHRTAEANRTSCAGCHVPEGEAFGAEGNCQSCHEGLTPTRRAALPAGAASALPGEIVFDTNLGRVPFDHAGHVELAEQDCKACHNQLFPMSRAPLNYGGADLHKTAEANNASCAGCHAPSESAFAAGQNCMRCHVDLEEPPQISQQPQEPGGPKELVFETGLGPVTYDHAEHVRLAEGKCRTCHTKVFPLSRAPINYGANLHQTAEANQTSCATCHVDGGSAFASRNNCQKCHTNLTSELLPGEGRMPGTVTYQARIGAVEFDHGAHVELAGGDCLACHPGLFPMAEAPLNYSPEDRHQTAEAKQVSCAGCHRPDGSAFAAQGNCAQCHTGPFGRLTMLPTGFAGSETCGACHQDIFRDFQRNPHRLIDESARWEARRMGCESCHGAGADHSRSTEPRLIFAFAEPQANRINEACLECHGSDLTHAGRMFDAHGRNSLDCLACHSVHEARADPLLANHTDELCSSCHMAERAAFNRPFRHRLQEGAISCVDCHEPHGQTPPVQGTRVSANEPVCLKCHADKRGPFPFEHAPVKMEPCTSCHEPHGSANPRMMARNNTSQLCLECHAGTMGVLGGAPTGFHDLRSARFQNCTICHTKIHGSFVSQDFLR